MTNLAVYGIPVAVAAIGWLFLRFIDDLVDGSYRDPFTRTRDQIRDLPERPELFDQEEVA